MEQYTVKSQYESTPVQGYMEQYTIKSHYTCPRVHGAWSHSMKSEMVVESLLFHHLSSMTCIYMVWKWLKIVPSHDDFIYFSFLLLFHSFFMFLLTESTSKPHFTSTLIVMTRESNTFSVSASIAFSWSHRGWPTWTCIQHKHRTSITFTWHHCARGSEMRFIRK